jgi:hypothetical protein
LSDSAAATFNAGHALAARDRDQVEEILRIVGPTIGPCLASENCEVVSLTLSFLNDMLSSGLLPIDTATVGDLMGFLSNESERIQIPAMLTCVRLSKEGLGDQVFNTVYGKLDADGSEIQRTAIEAVAILVDVLSEERQEMVFGRLREVVTGAVDVGVVSLSLKAVSGMVGRDPQKVDGGTQLVIQLISGQAGFLGDLSLVVVDTTHHLIQNFCELISACITHDVPLAPEISDFLVGLLHRENELDRTSAAGALSDAIEGNAIPPELCQQVVDTVIAELQTTRALGLQENSVYLLNVLVLKHPEFVATVCGLIHVLSDWWATAIETRCGYQQLIGNLSSLFIALAISRSEFPAELLAQVLAEFPDEESDTVGVMAQNILALVESREVGEEVMREVVKAVGRIAACDCARLMRMQVGEELLGRMQRMVGEAVAKWPELGDTVMKGAGRSRARAARLAAFLGQ